MKIISVYSLFRFYLQSKGRRDKNMTEKERKPILSSFLHVLTKNKPELFKKP